MTSIVSRRSGLAIAGISLLTPLAAQASASALLISSGATTDVTCLNGTCKATGPDAALNVGELQTLLASGNVTVTTGSASDDIKVTAALSAARSCSTHVIPSSSTPRSPTMVLARFLSRPMTAARAAFSHSAPKAMSRSQPYRIALRSTERNTSSSIAQGNRLKIRVTNGRRAESVVIL